MCWLGALSTVKLQLCITARLGENFIHPSAASGRHVQPTQRTGLECLAAVAGRTVLLGPRRHLPQKASPSGLGMIANLLNILQKPERVKQNKKTEQYVTNERIR